MSALINYIIESSVSLGVLTCFYLLAIRQGQNLPIKRFYLLFALVFSAVLPLLNLHFSWMESPVEQLEQSGASNVLSTITVVAGEWNSFTDNGMPVAPQHNWITWFYGAGMLLFLIRFIVGLARLGLMRNLHASEKTGKYRLFITSGKYRPFSFFRLVFIPETLWHSPAGEIIFTHEKEHARQYHSIDILLLELVLMVQWINPFAWMVRRQMKDNHEFMADRAVLKSGVKRTDYLQSMLVQMMGPHFEMANNFSLSITQKRIKMMKIKQIKDYMAAKISATLLVAVLLVFVFATEITYAQKQSAVQEAEEVVVPVTRIEKSTPPPPPPPPSAPEPSTIPPPPPPPPIEDQVFKVVEHMPEFPGGQDSMMQYLRSEIKYPPEAQKNKIQGRVYVQFVIDKSGKISKAEILRSVNPLLDDEALRVVNAMPDWTPGTQRGVKVNVEYVLPINFVLQEGKKKDSMESSNNSVLHVWMNENQINLAGDKEYYNYNDGLNKIKERIMSKDLDEIYLYSNNGFETGNMTINSLEKDLKETFNFNDVLTAIVITTPKCPKNESKEYMNKLQSFILKEKSDDVLLQSMSKKLVYNSKGDSSLAVFTLQTDSKYLELNKQVKQYVDKIHGNITYQFNSTFAKR